MDILSNSINQISSQLQIAWQAMGYVWFLVLPPIFYWFFKFLWMYHIQTAYWLSLDWMLLEIIPPKDIEKSPKPMEALFVGMAGTEKSFSVIEEFIQGAFPDSFSLELYSDGGEVHFYIRTQKKYRHLVEAHLYAQYPDVEIVEVPDYVNEVPKIIPNKDWDIWGTDFEHTKPDPYPIRTYVKFEESVTGKMIDPLASLIETMGKLAPGQKIWFQMVIAATSPTWGAKEGKKVLEKLKGKEVKKEGIFERMWIDIKDIITSIFSLGVLDGEVSLTTASKKEEQPLDMRLSPGEREVLKAVEDNIGKLFYSTKMRFVMVGRRQNFDKTFVSAFIGGIKQFGDENLNTLKPESPSKTSTVYWFTKSRLRYKQRKILRRYRNRSRDGVKMTLSTEELATLFHLPDMNVAAPALPRVEAKRGGAPANLPIE
ncbi:MAG TPA: hypothetical protein VF817_00785 [Patescibacteria group bacterium]